MQSLQTVKERQKNKPGGIMLKLRNQSVPLVRMQRYTANVKPLQKNENKSYIFGHYDK